MLYLQDVVQGAVVGGCCNMKLSTMPCRRRVDDGPVHVAVHVMRPGARSGPEQDVMNCPFT
jgi:hypothetical protein